MKKILRSLLLVVITFSLSITLCSARTVDITENSASPDVTEDDSALQDEPEIINVTVNPDKILFNSGLKLGATHTHYFWEKGNADAVKKATEIFKSFTAVNNQHIMGWGADNPWPKKDGPMDFVSLDDRVALLKNLKGERMITFCQAPGWMKGTDDWNMDAAVLDEYVPDFAKLCAAIAKRYPEVKNFQVWNEFKGYWSSEKNRWDYERYTKMYNQVYTEVKKVRPDAKVGGFYLVLEGDGSRELFGIEGTHDYMPLNDFQREAIKYWLENSAGADFICIDRGIVDYHNKEFIPTPEQTMVLTSVFEKVFRELTELTDLPIVLSEYYGYSLDKNGERDRELEAAQYAAIYKNILIGSGGRDVTALLWVESEDATPGSLFTDTDSLDGGEAFKHAEVIKNISDYFCEGSKIVDASADSDKIIVLASSKKTMLINTVSAKVKVQVNQGEIIELNPFEVKFIDN